MAKSKSLNEQAQEILEIAQKCGVQYNFFFVTTFKRYQVQLNILAGLEQSIKQEGSTVTKEYVKGRKNLYSNPAVADYNRTTDSANKTVSTLMRIIKGFGAGNEAENRERDDLMAAINGGDDYEEAD